MDTQIAIKEESCVNHESSGNMFSANTCHSYVGFGKIKQEKVQEESIIGSKCEPFHQEYTFGTDTEDMNVAMKLPSAEEIIIKDEILDCDALDKCFDNIGKPFQCEICKRKYSSKVSLQRHMKLHTGEKPFGCSFCKQKFSDKSKLQVHMRIHTSEKLYECYICKKRFAEKRHMQRHVGIHTGDKPFECGICGKKFADPSSVSRHMNTHTVEKFECTICKAKCTTPSKMRDHMRRHTVQKPYACNICKKKFVRKRNLLCHMRGFHTTEKSTQLRRLDKNDDTIDSPIKGEVYVKTEIRGEKALQKGSMDAQITVKEEICVNHEITTGLSSATNVCNNSEVELSKIKRKKVQDERTMGSEYELLHKEHIFEEDMEKMNVEMKLPPEEEGIIDGNTLNFDNRKTQHQRVDNEVKTFQCEICKQRYSQKCSLQRHMRLHTGEKPFECGICRQKFADISSVRRHVETHDGPSECEICKKKYSSKTRLRLHMRIHTGEKLYECGICNTKFVTQGHVRQHMKKHTGERLFECDTCKKKFAKKTQLQRHMGTHTGDKPFECRICRKKFADASSVPRHMNTHIGGKFECEICKKKYADKSNLRRHVRMHTGENLLECTVCKIKRATPSEMEKHMRTHIVEKPYACDICGKKFLKKCYLLQHTRSFHTIEKSTHLRKSDRNDDDMNSPSTEYIKSEISDELTDNLPEDVLDDHSIIAHIKQQVLQDELQPDGQRKTSEEKFNMFNDSEEKNMLETAANSCIKKEIINTLPM